MENIRELLETMDGDDLVALHNEFAESAGYSDDHIYSMSEFDEIVADGRTFEDVWSSLNEGFNMRDDYFWYDGYANISTGNATEAVDDNVDFNLLADWLEEDYSRAEGYDDLEEWVEAKENEEDSEDEDADYDLDEEEDK